MCCDIQPERWMDGDYTRWTSISSVGTYICDDRRGLGDTYLLILLNPLNVLCMKCYNCGNEIPNDAKYCLSCGRKVGDSGSANSAKEIQGSPEPRKRGRKQRRWPRIPYALRLLSFITIVAILVLLIVFKFR